MAFQLGEDHDSGMNEMNLIPLIDIMLVLMIIFLVTATVANPSIPLTLPKTTAEIIDPPPKAITISINANGEVAWDTHVDLDVQGDAHYPTIPNEFHKTASEQQVDEKSGTSFEFATYKK